MINYTIGITTFSLRFDLLERLVHQIRNYRNVNIIICINGEIKSNFIESYRLKVMKLCTENTNIFPIFFIEQRGLSKMWNTILSHSDSDNVLMLNDDIEINSSDIFDKLDILESIELIKLNNSFSNFIVNRRVIDYVGWFDEKLLGFGEEDGDIIDLSNPKNDPLSETILDIKNENIDFTSNKDITLKTLKIIKNIYDFNIL